MDNIIIRPATIHDMPVLLEFEQGVIAAERPFDVTLKDSRINYYDIEKMIFSETVELVVATLNGAPVGSGYARIEEAKPFLKYSRYAYLGFMYVLPQHRGKGINKLIMEALSKWAASKDMVELRLEVYHQNAAAIAAYEKAGFSKLLIEMRMPV
ncbi:GNAT family N-acetyltransferase [Ferruginibacter sp.]